MIQNTIERLYGTLPLFFSFRSLFSIKRVFVFLGVGQGDEIDVPLDEIIFCNESCLLRIDNTQLRIELVTMESLTNCIEEVFKLRSWNLVATRSIDLVVSLGGLIGHRGLVQSIHISLQIFALVSSST